MFPSSPLLMRADASDRTRGGSPRHLQLPRSFEALFCRLISFLGIVFTVGFVPLGEGMAHSPVWWTWCSCPLWEVCGGMSEFREGWWGMVQQWRRSKSLLNELIHKVFFLKITAISERPLGFIGQWKTLFSISCPKCYCPNSFHGNEGQEAKWTCFVLERVGWGHRDTI